MQLNSFIALVLLTVYLRGTLMKNNKKPLRDEVDKQTQVPIVLLKINSSSYLFQLPRCNYRHHYRNNRKKLTVLLVGGIIGPYFFKNDEGHNVTVNGDRYRAMITNFFIPELNNHDVQELWIQQDGATCHTARAAIYLLKDTLGDRLTSRFGPVNWPPRSCNLTRARLFSVGLCKVIGLCG
ncbi:heat shock 70kDa protein 8 [Trichonephila clavipes]|nr:heat shock 70kDa protein 8 [Trichonephila clavipes]